MFFIQAWKYEVKGDQVYPACLLPGYGYEHQQQWDRESGYHLYGDGRTAFQTGSHLRHGGVRITGQDSHR